MAWAWLATETQERRHVIHFWLTTLDWPCRIRYKLVERAVPFGIRVIVFSAIGSEYPLDRRRPSMETVRRFRKSIGIRHTRSMISDLFAVTERQPFSREMCT